MKEINLTAKIVVYPLEECSEIEKKLIEEAKTATQRAYSRYSHFSVGAAVLLENGEIISGSNQENAAYPSGTCAERTAVFYANSQFPEQRIVAIAIAAANEEKFTENVVTPCGACRQVLLETENRYKTAIKIMMYCNNEVYVAEGIKNLLPLSFGDEMLRGNGYS